MKEIFEYHLSDARSNPIILHYDTVRVDETFIYNWHPNTELLYFVQGNATVHMGTATVEAKAGDVVIVNSNLMHGVETEDFAGYYCIIPNREFCRFNGIDTENTTFAEKICDDESRRLYQAVVDAHNHHDDNLGDAQLKNAIMNLMIYIAHHYTENVAEGHQPKSLRCNEGIKVALGFIHAHVNRRLTIDELSDNAGLSKFYFVREFKRIVGDTPVAYINRLRCENAKKLLSDGVSVGDAAERCGFESVSYFGKVFKRYTGMTPAEYNSMDI